MTGYFYSGLYIFGLILLLVRAQGPADISGAITDAVAEVGDRRPEGTRLTTVAATGKHIRVHLYNYLLVASLYKVLLLHIDFLSNSFYIYDGK